MCARTFSTNGRRICLNHSLNGASSVTLITCFVGWVQPSSQSSKEKMWYSARSDWVESSSSGGQDPKLLKSVFSNSFSCICSAVSFCVWMLWPHPMCLTFQATSVALAADWPLPLLLLDSSPSESEGTPYCFSLQWWNSCCNCTSWCKHSVSSDCGTKTSLQHVGHESSIQPRTGECGLHLCMYNSGWESVNHFTTPGGDYFIVFIGIQYSSSHLVIFQHSSHSSGLQKVGHMDIDLGCSQCVYLLFYYIYNAAYCGGSQDHRDLSHKVGQIHDYEGYLILIISLDSIYLNPYDDIANRLSKGVSQACTDDSSTHKVWERLDVQGVIFNKPQCNGVDLGTIVQEAHTSLPVDYYPGYILNPIP